MLTQVEIQAQNREIDLALARAAVKHEGKTAAEATADSNQRLRSNAPPSPHETLRTILISGLSRWCDVPQSMLGGRPAATYARPRCQAALDLLDDALALLNAKTGDRAESARAALTAQRAEIQAACDLFDSIGGAALDGPLALSYLERIVSTRAASAAAAHAYIFAKPEEIPAILIVVEQAAAAVRELDRDVFATRDALNVVPELPDAASYEAARADTLAIEKLPKARPSARQMFGVLQAAFSVNPAVSRWHVVHESQADHALIQLRAKAIAEGGA